MKNKEIAKLLGVVAISSVLVTGCSLNDEPTLMYGPAPIPKESIEEAEMEDVEEAENSASEEDTEYVPEEDMYTVMYGVFPN